MEIAIRTGRRHANDEQFAQAVEVWKEALGAAYSQQDFASLFVLSKNVGEVCRRLASQSKEPLSLLQEALEHFDYALGVINECSLRNVLGSYKALYCSVRRVEMERGRVMKQIREIQDGEAHLQKEKGAIECATCGIGSGEMVLDENDGCYYCRTCYEEYYAAERETEDELPCKDRIESWQKTEGPDNSGDDEESEKSAVDENSGEDTTLARVNPSLEEPNERVQAQERLRHSRVELGSLADFLAGTVHLEDKGDEILPTEQKRQTKVQGYEAADASESSAASITRTVNPQEDRGEESTAIFISESNESSADELKTSTGKTQYSIAELLDFRSLSPSGCPEALLTSPVRDDGTVKANSRRKTTTKKTLRANALQKTQRASVLKATVAEVGGVPPESLLPSMDLCTAMRTTYQEHRANCSNESAMEELAAALFDSKESPPFSTQARILSDGWCKDGLLQ